MIPVSAVQTLVAQHASRSFLIRGNHVGDRGEVTFFVSAFDGYAEEPDYLHLRVMDGEYTLTEWPQEAPKVLSEGRLLGVLIDEATIHARRAELSASARERMAA